MHQARARLYHADEAHRIPWPPTPDGYYARTFLAPLLSGTQPYIDNVDTQMMALLIDDKVLPVTLNDAQYKNCYVCSPYGLYIDCARDWVKKHDSRCVRYTVRPLLKILKRLLKFCEINKVVCVNNWLVSTNLYPNLTSEQIAVVTATLKQRFPDHAIIFRSVNSRTTPDIQEALVHSGYSLVANRKVFFLDTRRDELFTSRLFKSDLKALRESPYQVIRNEDITSADIHRLHSLYTSLYIDKHSRLNIQFTEQFFSYAIKHRILRIIALKKNDRIDGFVGYFIRNGIMTAPVIGYDMSLPKETKLYRQLSTLLELEARQEKLILHASSGAAFYKKIRKAEDAVEHMAIMHSHLPRHRRLPWQILSFLGRTVATWLIKNHSL